jgi:hypothetical protein
MAGKGPKHGHAQKSDSAKSGHEPELRKPRADLAAAYRDWSWQERCQFSDLVDRAMESYLKKARKPERE